jgi:hypothetical protein
MLLQEMIAVILLFQMLYKLIPNVMSSVCVLRRLVTLECIVMMMNVTTEDIQRKVTERHHTEWKFEVIISDCGPSL